MEASTSFVRRRLRPDEEEESSVQNWEVFSRDFNRSSSGRQNKGFRISLSLFGLKLLSKMNKEVHVTSLSGVLEYLENGRADQRMIS